MNSLFGLSIISPILAISKIAMVCFGLFGELCYSAPRGLDDSDFADSSAKRILWLTVRRWSKAPSKRFRSGSSPANFARDVGYPVSASCRKSCR